MRRTILIVDDHAGFRRWAGAPLATQGYAVLGEGRDGASAIGAVGTPQPDVVLPGLRLPGMDGVAVARSLAADGGAAAVVLTSSRDAADVGGRTAAVRRMRPHREGRCVRRLAGCGARHAEELS